MQLGTLLGCSALGVCISACAAGLVLPAPSLGGPAVHGRVVEGVSGKPIGGAIVAVYWNGVVPIKGSHTCFHVETAVTADDGTYHTPAWTFPAPVSYAEPEVRYDVYKSGMTLVGGTIDGASLELSKFQGGREERLKELQRMSRVARCIMQPSNGIAQLRDAIAGEVAQLVSTEQQRRVYLDEARELSRSEREAAEEYARYASDKGVTRK